MVLCSSLIVKMKLMNKLHGDVGPRQYTQMQNRKLKPDGAPELGKQCGNGSSGFPLGKRTTIPGEEISKPLVAKDKTKVPLIGICPEISVA